MAEKTRIALAPGDGIGPEIMDAALSIFRAAGVEGHVEFVPVEMGESVFDRDTRGMTDETVRMIERTGLVYKGPMGTPKGGGGKSINVSLRKMYGAFANIRHFQSLPGVETVYSRAGVPVDFYVIRENIEDTYGGIEHRLTRDVVECKRLISAPGCDQVHRAAFELADRLGIESVYCGHKANIMKMTDGLFLERFRSVAAEYPGIEHGDVIIDALCMNLVLRPQNYKMVVLPNLQGDIVSDLAAGLVGGLGFAPSANIGKHVSIFEAVHGTAPDIAGKGVANPTSLLLSGIMMLRHIGMLRQAALIENALLVTLESGVRTGDFGDPSTEAVGTRGFADAIASNLGRKPESRAVVEPDSLPSAPSLVRPQPPMTNTMLGVFTEARVEHVGADIYVESDLGPAGLAERLAAAVEGTPFRLSMMSNRGTQVWPTGSTFTECVDHYRARFLLRKEQTVARIGCVECLELAGRIAATVEVVECQMLKTYDGERGYSLAQGQ